MEIHTTHHCSYVFHFLSSLLLSYSLYYLSLFLSSTIFVLGLIRMYHAMWPQIHLFCGQSLLWTFLFFSISLFLFLFLLFLSLFFSIYLIADFSLHIFKGFETCIWLVNINTLTGYSSIQHSIQFLFHILWPRNPLHCHPWCFGETFPFDSICSIKLEVYFMPNTCKTVCSHEYRQFSITYFKSPLNATAEAAAAWWTMLKHQLIYTLYAEKTTIENDLTEQTWCIHI